MPIGQLNAIEPENAIERKERLDTKQFSTARHALRAAVAQAL